mgnify:FL=1
MKYNNKYTIKLIVNFLLIICLIHMIKFILCSNNIVDNNYSNTEIKIKDAAKSLFLKKGYSATTTRDIARESDINLAMLNYYFRSKRRLFELSLIHI